MLSAFVERPAVRDAFRAYAARVKLPPEHKGAPLLVQSCGSKHSSVGTAFDYLARFRIARDLVRDAGPGDVDVWDTGWVAEQSVAAMEGHPRYARHHPRWRHLVARARELVDRYVAGEETDVARLAKCAQYLGAADLLTRIGDFNPSFAADDDVQAELLELDALFEPAAILAPRKACLLNPCLPLGAALGGADPDLLIDDLLLDVKTTLAMGVSSNHLRQLSGYAVLQAEGGASLGDGSLHRDTPRAVGIYFSRYARLVTWDLSELFPGDGFARFSAAFMAEMEAVAEPVPSRAP